MDGWLPTNGTSAFHRKHYRKLTKDTPTLNVALLSPGTFPVNQNFRRNAGTVKEGHRERRLITVTIGEFSSIRQPKFLKLSPYRDDRPPVV